MRYRLLACCLWLCVSSVFAKDMSPIVDMVNQSMPGSHFGIMVQDMDTGAWLYRYHSLDYFEPASVDKLLVGGASLVGLGPDWRYQTTAWVRKGQLKHGVLRSDLVITFSGDPSFTEKDLHQLVLDIKEAGVNQVKGRVLLDGHRFSTVWYPPGWTQDSLIWGYSAPVSAIMLDKNAIPVTLRSNEVLGKRAHVQMNRYQQKYLASVHTETVSQDQADHHCSLVVTSNELNQYRFSGCWPIGLKKKSMRVAVQHPDAYMMNRLRAQFKQVGIKVGHIQHAKKVLRPEGYEAIARYESPPLKNLIGPLLRDSDNLYAESLLKTLGWRFGGSGSFQEGLNQEQALLNRYLDMGFKNDNNFDGSGASRYDRVTPQLMARLLYVMYHDRKVRKYLMRALPSSGFNGTLKNRMRSFDVKGQIRAKTGSLKHVSTLAGYMTTRNERHLAFVVMVNDVMGPLRPARDVQNRICQYLMQF